MNNHLFTPRTRDTAPALVVLPFRPRVSRVVRAIGLQHRRELILCSSDFAKFRPIHR